MSTRSTTAIAFGALLAFVSAVALASDPPERGFDVAVATGRPSYLLGEPVEVRVTVTNRSTATASQDFGCPCCGLELWIEGATGELVGTWHSPVSCPQVPVTVPWAGGETKLWMYGQWYQDSGSFDLLEPAGSPVGPGRYRIVIRWLGSSDGGLYDTWVRVLDSDADLDSVYYLPAVASTPGLHGSEWHSTLVLRNLSSSDATIELAALVQGQRNVDPVRLSLSIPANQPLVVTEPLALLGGIEGAAALRVTSTGPIDGFARVFDGSGEGTRGQRVPLVPASTGARAVLLQGLAPVRPDQLCGGVLCYRANVGVVNLSPGEVVVAVAVMVHGEADGLFPVRLLHLGGFLHDSSEVKRGEGGAGC
jgi:hypothetical protein